MWLLTKTTTRNSAARARPYSRRSSLENIFGGQIFDDVATKFLMFVPRNHDRACAMFTTIFRESCHYLKVRLTDSRNVFAAKVRTQASALE